MLLVYMRDSGAFGCRLHFFFDSVQIPLDCSPRVRGLGTSELHRCCHAVLSKRDSTRAAGYSNLPSNALGPDKEADVSMIHAVERSGKLKFVSCTGEDFVRCYISEFVERPCYVL